MAASACCCSYSSYTLARHVVAGRGAAAAAVAPPRARLSAASSAAFGRSLGVSFAVPVSEVSPVAAARDRTVRAMASAGTAVAGKKTLHDFTVEDIDGKQVSLSEYKGKVALVVNVASACGLTQSNYTELTKLYEAYKDKGFVVLAFPSNQFGKQEPGDNAQIKDFACSRYKATFPLFSKIDVNGDDAAPVYKFLKSEKGGGILGSAIKWNFGKFLIDKDGNVVERYAPTTSPAAIAKDLEKLL